MKIDNGILCKIWDIIIFSPYFDKPLYHELLSNYKRIIFSDYNLCDGLFEAYENNNFINLIWINSKFNQPLTDSLNKLTSLTHLTFGGNFNQPLANTLGSLTSLPHI